MVEHYGYNNNNNNMLFVLHGRPEGCHSRLPLRLTRTPLVRDVDSSNLKLVKSYTALQTVRHR